MEHTIDDVILDRASRLTDAEKKIADVVLQDGYELALYTVTELADSAGVSESTVVRFARKLGYGGFRELQEQLQKELEKELGRSLSQRRTEKHKLDADSPYLETLLAQELKCIDDTYRHLTPEQIQRMVHGLCNADQVFVVGARASSAAALYTAYYLGLLRPRVHPIVYTVGNAIQTSLDMTDSDVLLAFAFARYTHQTVELMEEAADLGVTVYCITDTLMGAPAQLASEAIVVRRESGLFLASYTPVVSVAYALVGAVEKALGDKVQERIERLEVLNLRSSKR